MGRLSDEVTAKFVESNRHAKGMYCDGGGLYLRVASGGSKQWIFRYAADDPSHERGYRLRDMGLGSVDDLSLAEAREEARKLRILRKQKIDPISHRVIERAQRIAAQTKMRTFQQCAEEYIAGNKSKKWTSDKHRREFETTLRKYAFPKLGLLPVHTIETPHILEIIKPLWDRIPTTALRTLNRIDSVLDWATVHQYRKGDNPARWRDYIEHALPPVPDPEHLAALPYKDLPAFMGRLRETSGVNARCLEFLILTCLRAETAAAAVWSEFDEPGVWTIPPERMKRKREHRVPLSVRAIEIVDEMRACRQSDFVFPGARAARPIDKDAPNEVAQKIVGGGVEVTAHGMRSTFKDWASEETSFEDIVSEMALAHKVKDSTVKAYRRGDLFEKRRRLMDAWAEYCGKPQASGRVVALRGK